MRVCVIFGGQSTEHDVSCLSVINVADMIVEAGHELVMIGITKDGRWKLVASLDDIKNNAWKNGKTAIISPEENQKKIIVLLDNNKMECIDIDVVFPVLHGKMGEDGTIQGLLELSGIPYVGCDVMASAIGMEKSITKVIVEKLGIPQAKTIIIQNLSEISDLNSRIIEQMGYPVFVKPSKSGSSCGVSRVDCEFQLQDAVKLAFEHDDVVLIEEMIVGRELECAVLETSDGLVASNPGEVLSGDEFYSYDAKYNCSDSKTILDPDVSEKIKNLIKEYAIRIFRGLHCRGLSRVDFFYDIVNDRIIFNEINTLPGFTNISMYPMLIKNSGITSNKLINELVTNAIIKNDRG